VSSDLIPGPESGPLARRRALEDVARGYATASKAPNTIRAYRRDLRDFEDFCSEAGLAPLPASSETVALYLASLAEAGAKASTIERRVAAISQAHQLAGHVPSPTQDWMVRATMSGIRRTIGTAPAKKAAAVTAELRRFVDVCPADTLAGRRDRAVLLLGFAGAFRRSELVSLDVDDLEETTDGLRLQLRRSKTDPEAAGTEKGIPFGAHPETCPVRAVRAWLAAADIEQGALFRPVNRHDQLQPGRLTDQSVALIVKRAALRAGLDASRYAGHSLRSGLATSAADGGAPERAIARQTGHRSLEVLRGYIRAGTLFHENAAAYTGL
jgi:site-specific recombinase XerD